MQTHETSELSTFNEYDMMTDDDQALGTNMSDLLSGPIDDPSHLPNPLLVTSEDDCDSAISGRSSGSRDYR